MNCDRCTQPLGLVSYTVTAWAGDDELATMTLCAGCGGTYGDGPTLAQQYHLELGAG